MGRKRCRAEQIRAMNRMVGLCACGNERAEARKRCQDCIDDGKAYHASFADRQHQRKAGTLGWRGQAKAVQP